jgi:hypothetical protein
MTLDNKQPEAQKVVNKGFLADSSAIANSLYISAKVKMGISASCGPNRNNIFRFLIGLGS